MVSLRSTERSRRHRHRPLTLSYQGLPTPRSAESERNVDFANWPKARKIRYSSYDGNNFGLFGGPKRARKLLKMFYTLTSPEARIIAESLDVYRPPVGEVHRRYHLRNRRRGRMPGQVRIRVRYKTYATPWFDYLLVSPAEMKKILKGTGWRVMRPVKSGESPAYIVVITKDQ